MTDELREKIARAIDPSAFDEMVAEIPLAQAWKGRAYIAADRALATIEAEGMVIVPREPTEAMLEAAAPRPSHWPAKGSDIQRDVAVALDQASAATTYRRMIAASQETPHE